MRTLYVLWMINFQEKRKWGKKKVVKKKSKTQNTRSNCTKSMFLGALSVLCAFSYFYFGRWHSICGLRACETYFNLFRAIGVSVLSKMLCVCLPSMTSIEMNKFSEDMKIGVSTKWWANTRAHTHGRLRKIKRNAILSFLTSQSIKMLPFDYVFARRVLRSVIRKVPFRLTLRLTHQIVRRMKKAKQAKVWFKSIAKWAIQMQRVAKRSHANRSVIFFFILLTIHCELARNAHVQVMENGLHSLSGLVNQTSEPREEENKNCI